MFFTNVNIIDTDKNRSLNVDYGGKNWKQILFLDQSTSTDVAHVNKWILISCKQVEASGEDESVGAFFSSLLRSRKKEILRRRDSSRG